MMAQQTLQDITKMIRSRRSDAPPHVTSLTGAHEVEWADKTKHDGHWRIDNKPLQR